MTVLVTGGAGYIGSHMMLRFADMGEPVVVIDNLSTGFREAVPADIPFYHGNVGDRELVARILRTHEVDAIVHFAASAIVPDSMRDPLGYYGNNTIASHGLLSEAVAHGVKHFIFSSTCAVYGDVGATPVSETTPVAPVSPYGRSKFMTETMLRDVAEAHGLKFAILRYFNVAGADPHMRAGQSTVAATHLIKAAVQAALHLRPRLDVYGTDYATPDGTCVRDYIHVSDLAAAHAAALTHLRAGHPSLLLNCGYSRGFSVQQVIDTVKAVSGVDFPVTKAPRRPGDPASVVADTHGIRDTLHWTPDFDDLRTIVTHALAWESKIAGQNRSSKTG